MSNTFWFPDEPHCLPNSVVAVLSLSKVYLYLFHKVQLMNIYILPAIYKRPLLQDFNVCNKVSPINFIYY
jgi:hypothetical protein